MSRSKPELHSGTPNPAKKWFEWDGENGGFCYYDKEKKESFAIADGFTFIVLDQLASVTGYSESDNTGIFSNEVRDTKKETLTVKTFKGKVLGEGFYMDIRDKVKVQGGKFTTVLYIAFKDGDNLVLGGVKFAGGALSIWMDFQKENRKGIYEKAVKVKGFIDKKKGKIDYRIPKEMKLVEINDETNKDATRIDSEILQPYLAGYFGKTRTDQVSPQSNNEEPDDRRDHSQAPPPDPDLDPNPDDSDPPF